MQLDLVQGFVRIPLPSQLAKHSWRIDRNVRRADARIALITQKTSSVLLTLDAIVVNNSFGTED